MLKLGEKIINQIYLGDKKIAKVFWGDKLVYQAGEPIFLDYIESTGTQMIDTGITANIGKGGTWTVTAQSTVTNKLRMLLANGGTGPQFFGYNSRGKWGFGESIYFDINADTKITAKVVFEETQVTAVIGDETLVRTGSHNIKPFILGGYIISATNNYNFVGRIFGCSYEDIDGNLLLDLRPCIDPNGTVCMYDMVTRKYFYNAGTGEFIAGYKPIDIDYTRIFAYVDGLNAWKYAYDSYSILIPVEVGKKYQLAWENTTSDVGTIFRYGQTDIPEAQGQILNDCVRTSPQSTPVAELTAINDYLVIQITGATANVVVANKYLKLYEIP